MLSFFGHSFGNSHGFFRIDRLIAGETRWFASCSREFGLWMLSLKGFGLSMEVIGPFGGKRA